MWIVCCGRFMLKIDFNLPITDSNCFFLIKRCFKGSLKNVIKLWVRVVLDLFSVEFNIKLNKSYFKSLVHAMRTQNLSFKFNITSFFPHFNSMSSHLLTNPQTAVTPWWNCLGLYLEPWFPLYVEQTDRLITSFAPHNREPYLSNILSAIW